MHLSWIRIPSTPCYRSQLSMPPMLRLSAKGLISSSTRITRSADEAALKPRACYNSESQSAFSISGAKNSHAWHDHALDQANCSTLRIGQTRSTLISNCWQSEGRCKEGESQVILPRIHQLERTRCQATSDTCIDFIGRNEDTTKAVLQEGLPTRGKPEGDEWRDDSCKEAEAGGEQRHKYRVTLAYDGTGLKGWQVQASAPTVQQLLEGALQALTGGTLSRHQLAVAGAGRTDAGVHARGQVAHFLTPAPLPDLARVHTSLNGLLPHSVRVLEVAAALPAFHARYSATGKTYHYHVQNGPVMDPFRRRYALHTNRALDCEAMREAARFLVGEHDFAALANASLVKERNAVRRIHRVDLLEEEGGIRWEVEGTGFLYKQVRNMVGLLLVVGQGAITPSVVPLLLRSLDRNKVARIAPTAPPQGLSLVHVEYPAEILHPPKDAPNPSQGSLHGPKEAQKKFILDDNLRVHVTYS